MLTNDGNGNMIMPVAPTGSFGGGFGNGDNGWWIILLFILLGGFGNNWGNGGGGGNVQRGFDQAELTSGIGNLQSSICNGFAQAESSANARQIADIQSANALQAQFANCCCENRLASADLKATILSENCSDRQVITDALRDLLVNQNNNTQKILDTMCQDKIDAKNDTINQLRQELLYSRGQASQDVQTAALRQSMLANDQALLNELRSCPIPSMPVYGQTPIFTCNQNQCGCGCNAGCGCGM